MKLGRLHKSMKLWLRLSGTIDVRRRNIKLCAFFCVATLCGLAGYGATAAAQVPAQPQRNGPKGQPAAVDPSVVKAREESLRKRVDEFYQLLQAVRIEQAEAFVTPDSKEVFRREKAGGFLGFKIDSVRLEPGGGKATVVVRVQQIVPHMMSPMTVPRETEWVWVDGLWYVAVTAPAAQEGDMKSLFKGTGVKSKTPPGDLKFKDNRYVMGKIQTGQVTVAKFPFTNTSDHAVTLSRIDTFCDCLKAKVAKEEFKPGESGELDVEFDSKGFKLDYAQTIVVKTDPGNQTAYLSVVGYVVPPQRDISKQKTSGKSVQ